MYSRNLASSPSDNGEDPILWQLKVPSLCNYELYCQPGLQFSAIPGVLHGQDIQSFTNDDIHEEMLTSTVSILQGWLFFGLLAEVSRICRVNFVPSDMVCTSTTTGESFITTKQLKKYFWYWIAAEYPKTIEAKRADWSRFWACTRIVNQVLNAWVEKTSTLGSALADNVLLSLVVVADSINHASEYMFIENPNVPRALAWSYPTLSRQLLLDSGWCVGELSGLCARCPPSVLLFLSRIERRREDKDHSNCTSSAGCLVNQLDVNSYVPSHAQGCSRLGCSFIATPVPIIRRVLQDGGIPLVRIAASSNHNQLCIEVSTFSLDNPNQIPGYVAISHVWSDGMGNPNINALRACQLRRIQGRVNQLYQQREQQNHPFWMDTLCVPLRDDMRSLAISRMAKTYMHADKVLVLDRSLESIDSDTDPRQLMAKITHCDWNTRLWTFQEVRLARECCFQLRDKAVTIDSLRFHVAVTQNLQSLSDMLSEEKEEDLMQHEQARRLIRALGHKDRHARERMRIYAELPPQDDPDEEDLRLTAIRSLEETAFLEDIRNKWQPLTARIQQQDPSADLHQDESLQTHIHTALLDPVVSYGTNFLIRMRGAYYDITLDRAKDLRDGALRQITGLTTKAEALLQDTARGLPGRMTSRLEDETICLGGLIGVDVSPMLKHRVVDQFDTAEVHRTRVQRMKTFLRLVRFLPASAPFWDVPRLDDENDEQGWRWAPLSFLHERACVGMGGTRGMVCAERGFVARYAGIRLGELRGGVAEHGAEQHEGKLLAIDYLDDEVRNAALDQVVTFRRSWQLVTLRGKPTRAPSSSRQHQSAPTSWHGYFQKSRTDGTGLAIVTYQELVNFEGILVALLKNDGNENKGDAMWCRYLTNVCRVQSREKQDGVERRRMFCEGHWVEGREWCFR